MISGRGVHGRGGGLSSFGSGSVRLAVSSRNIDFAAVIALPVAMLAQLIHAHSIADSHILWTRGRSPEVSYTSRPVEQGSVNP